MKIIKLYLRQRRNVIILSLICIGVFLCAFALYGLPLEAVAYPGAICMMLAAASVLLDIRRAGAKHRALSEISRLPACMIHDLPPVCSPDDADYQEIIRALCGEEKRVRTETAIKYQEMTDYYTIWAHQIKTPIAAMRLTLQDEDSRLSRMLSEELQRIEQYVEMVLAFLRLDSESRDYVFRRQPLDPIVREAVKKFSGQFIRKKIRLCYEPLDGEVLTDEKWLSFVIEQILSNSLKYTFTGSVFIYTEAPLTLCIKDTGIGISPEDLPRVFEKSYTGYNGRRDKKASGIGLYLCKRVCDGLGHRISAESSPGEGTVVRIFLDRGSLKTE